MHWNHLLRTRVSSFTLKDSLKLPEIEKLQESGKIEQILMPSMLFLCSIRAYRSWKSRKRSSETAIRFVFVRYRTFCRKGRNVDELEKNRIRVYDTGGQFCAIYEYREEKGMFFPVKMFL